MFLVSGCFGIQGASFVGAAAAWIASEFRYIPKQVMCVAAAACWCTISALLFIFALEDFDHGSFAIPATLVGMFIFAMGSMGITTSGQVDLWEGNSRPPQKSLPGAAAGACRTQASSSDCTDTGCT